MKTTIRLACTLLMIASAQSAFASYAWTGKATIINILPNGSFSGWPAGTTIQIDVAFNPENCNHGNYFFLDRNMAGYKELIALMMSAYFAGRQVNLLIEGCGSSAWAGPLVKGAQLM
jgi:hypothetical protein